MMTKQLRETFMLLCKLFSGESATYHFATETARDIEPNTTFCLLGTTQLQNAAKIIYRMDQGHGLLDRFLVAIPLALRPTPEQLDQACGHINEMALSDFKLPFDSIFDAHTNIVRVYISLMMKPHKFTGISSVTLLQK